jgi:putative transposase
MAHFPAAPDRLVTDLKDYPWSSYLAHGLGRSLPLLDEAPVWASLGRTEEARQIHWRKWVHTPLTAKDLAAVRRSVTTGRPYGGDAWVERTAARLGLDLAPRRRGRPPKTKVEHNLI